MANEFVIKKGLSINLFNEDGTCKIQDQLVENGWYLTTDTAEVFVALRQPNDVLELKKINDIDFNSDIDLEEFDNRLSALENEQKVHTYGYRASFPSIGDEGHVYVAVDEKKSYVWFSNEYIAIESGYEEPQVIFGGTAD